MQFETQSFSNGPVEFDTVLLKDEIGLETERARLIADVSIRGEASGEPGRIDISANFETQLEAGCVRCLELVTLPLIVEFRAVYVEPSLFAAASEHEVSVDDLAVDVLEDEAVDLRNVIHEQILLNLPEQLFCKDDCRGLCEKCGANRNLIDCKCIDDDIDPRWAALKNLK